MFSQIVDRLAEVVARAWNDEPGAARAGARRASGPADAARHRPRIRVGSDLQDEHGRSQLVAPRAFGMMIRAAAPNVRVVVLDGCYTPGQAEALRSAVGCVVGLAGRVRDDAAREFAKRFYGAIGNRRSVGCAVAQGVAGLAERQLPEHALPRCLTRHGVDADRLVLVSPATYAAAEPRATDPEPATRFTPPRAAA
jgi:hypothetical protein